MHILDIFVLMPLITSLSLRLKDSGEMFSSSNPHQKHTFKIYRSLYDTQADVDFIRL